MTPTVRRVGSLMRFACLLSLWLLALTPEARAQANYDGVKLGGRTSMMGGAAVARGSDGATAFINPAGITRIPGESFSFGTFALEMGGRNIDGFSDPSGTLGLKDADAGSVDVRILPNTFCLFLDGPPKDHHSGRSRHKYGLCAADTEQEEFSFMRNRMESGAGLIKANTQTTRMKWARSTLAAAWGFELMPGLAIGVTARFDNSRLEDSTSATAVASVDSGTDMQTLTQARQGSSWDTSVILGLSYQVSRVVTLGASLSTPSQHIMGFYSGSQAFAPVTGAARSVVLDDGDFFYNQPTNLRLGLAFSWPRVMFELNGSLYGAQDELARADFDRRILVTENGTLTEAWAGRGSLVERAVPVTNIMAGAEFFIEPDFSIVTGIQTDFTGLTPRQNSVPANTLFRQAKDAVHVSLGATTYGSAGSLLLGLRGFYAGGSVLIADPSLPTPTFEALSQSQWGLSLVISGQISFEAVRDTAVRAASPLVPSSTEVEPAPSAVSPAGGPSSWGRK